jgi:hypothetical protein
VQHRRAAGLHADLRRREHLQRHGGRERDDSVYWRQSLQVHLSI